MRSTYLFFLAHLKILTQIAMKKYAFLLTFLITTSVVTSQEIVTEFWHENGKYFNFHSIVETSDNCLILSCPMFEEAFSGSDIGNMFYKVSMTGELLDSLLIASDNVPLKTLFEPVPDMEGAFLYGRFEQEESDSTTYFRLTFLDNNLNLTDYLEIPVESYLDSYIITVSDLFIDPKGDIIASYWGTQYFNMLRIGIDGTIKHRKEMEMESGLLLQPKHTGMFTNTPLTYYYFGKKVGGGMQAYFMDSLFQVVGDHEYYKTNNTNWFVGGMQEYIVPYNDSIHLLSSRFRQNVSHSCTALAKFDNQFNLLKISLFEEEYPYNGIGPIQAIVAAPDTIYYGFMTGTGYFNQLALVCYDADLDIRWTRYFLEPDMFHFATCMTILHDGKVAIGSYKYGENPGSVSMVIIKDELWDVPENQSFIRPYAYWPNPAKDELHLHYSPDVTPTQIELYDLQGRLVRTQRNGLETLEMNGLASGTYTMRVTLEGGKTFTDKVVKE